MKFKANSDTARPANASSQPSAPSVPISVYRELAAELQATRAMVNSLNVKNQELTGQNQRLRQEIHRFAQTAIALQTIVSPQNSAGAQPAVSSTQHQPEPPSEPTLEQAAAATRMAAKLRSSHPAATELHTEAPTAPLQPERRPTALGGLWLTLSIVLIMLTAFGAGFLVVRPLLPSSK
jgi:hypothetical protein